MNFIFLTSMYPVLSETFLFEQFRILKSSGFSMSVVANRRPAIEEVHPTMRNEINETIYLNGYNLFHMISAHWRLLIRHPFKYAAAWTKIFTSREKISRSLAYFTGAALVLQRFTSWTPFHLHAHFLYGAAKVALWAYRLEGASYSLTIHGSELIFDDVRDLEDLLSEASCIVLISRFNINQIKTRFPNVDLTKLVHIPMGIEKKGIAPIHRDLNFADRTIRILNVGRLSVHKDQRNLIMACALLKDEGVDFQLSIVGEGPLRPEIEELIEMHGLDNEVDLLGAKYHGEVLKLYEQADLFVLSSVTEGIPVVLMEAMQAGTPVISTNVGAISELIDHGRNGLLVPPQAPEALAEAIAHFKNGRYDVSAMVENAAHTVADQFDLETNTLRFKDFLENRQGVSGCI